MLLIIEIFKFIILLKNILYLYIMINDFFLENAYIIVIIILIIILYIIYKIIKINRLKYECFDNTTDIQQAVNTFYNMDIEAMRNLTSISDKILLNNNIVLPSKLTIPGDLSLSNGNFNINNKGELNISNTVQITENGNALFANSKISNGSILTGNSTNVTPPNNGIYTENIYANRFINNNMVLNGDGSASFFSDKIVFTKDGAVKIGGFTILNGGDKLDFVTPNNKTVTMYNNASIEALGKNTNVGLVNGDTIKIRYGNTDRYLTNVHRWDNGANPALFMPRHWRSRIGVEDNDNTINMKIHMA